MIGTLFIDQRLSLSLSLSLTHTHTHTHKLRHSVKQILVKAICLYPVIVPSLEIDQCLKSLLYLNKTGYDQFNDCSILF